MTKQLKRYICYKCSNNMNHINFNGEISSKNNINISNYIPRTIADLVNNIHNKYNNNYIVCPYYKKYYDYQIGITETVKFDESNNDAILRGVNEEVGLSNITWDISNTITYNNWYGVLTHNSSYTYNPNSIHNTNYDTCNKVAIILHDNIYSLIKKFESIKQGDIITDGINGIGFISVYDCKKIVNYKL